MQKKDIYIRIAILLSLFVLPWWTVLIFLFASLFYFENFYEVICMGLFFDILYHSDNTMFGLYGFTIVACVLFLLSKQIKKRLIVY
jgi:hypothetical protein